MDCQVIPVSRKSYWSAAAGTPTEMDAPGTRRSGRLLHPLLGRRVVAASNDQIFEAELAADRPPLLADHKVQGMVVMPGAGYLEMVLAASAATHGQAVERLLDAMLIEPLLLEKIPKTVQTVLSPEGWASRRFGS